MLSFPFSASWTVCSIVSHIQRVEKVKSTPQYPFVFLVLLSMIMLARPVNAQDVVESPDVTIQVEGLACPLCAYGLEKRLKKIDSIEAISVHLKTGEVRIKLKQGTPITEERIRKAVLDAGFTLTGITYREKEAKSSGGRR